MLSVVKILAVKYILSLTALFREYAEIAAVAVFGALYDPKPFARNKRASAFIKVVVVFVVKINADSQRSLVIRKLRLITAIRDAFGFLRN